MLPQMLTAADRQSGKSPQRPALSWVWILDHSMAQVCHVSTAWPPALISRKQLPSYPAGTGTGTSPTVLKALLNALGWGARHWGEA